MSDWALRHAPELAVLGEDGDVWMLTCDGEDVMDIYGRGIAHAVLRDLQADERAVDR